MSSQSSPPLLLVHGWAGSPATWRPFRQALEASGDRRQVAAVALPGAPGATTHEPSDIPGATRAVLDVLRTLDGPAMLVGHSMGAQITLLAQVARPDLVHAEVVLDPAYGSTSDRAEMARWADEIEEGGHERLRAFFAEATDSPLLDDVREQIVADVLATPVPSIVRYLRSEYVDPESIGLLPATTAAAAGRTRPVLAIHTRSAGAATETSLPAPPGSRVVRWTGHSHFLHLERPARLVDDIARWAGRPAADPVTAPRT